MKESNVETGVWLTVGLALILPFSMWYGFVIKTLWGWFIVPLGVPRLSVWAAAGVFLIVRLLTTDVGLQRRDETLEEFNITQIVAGICIPAFSLAVAAIYHAFAT